MDTDSSSHPPAASATHIAHAEFKAMVLLVMVFVLACGFLGYVMVARGAFDRTQQVILVAEDSEGVLVGMEMSFSGFPIGRVRRVDLADDGKARILIDVPSKDARWLRTSTVFTLERSLVGSTRIRAFTGLIEDPPLPDGAERPVLIGDASTEIPHLVSTLRTVVDNLQQMTNENSSINASLGHLKTVTERMSGRYGALTAALGSDENARKVIATLDRTNSLLAKADKRVFGPKGVMDDSQAAIAQLNALLADARDNLKKVDAVLIEAQAIGANARVATTDLGALRAEVDASLRKVSQLVDEINRKWPFARDTELKLP